MTALRDKLAVRRWDPVRPAGKDGRDAPWLDPDRLLQPMRWRKPWNVLCCSEVDLFDPDLYPTVVDAVFAAMVVSVRQSFVVVTSFPEEAEGYLIRQEENAIRNGHTNPLWWQVDNDINRFIIEANRYGSESHEWIGELLSWSDFVRVKRLRAQWHYNEPQVGDFGRVELAGYWEWIGEPEDYPFRWPPPNISVLKRLEVEGINGKN